MGWQELLQCTVLSVTSSLDNLAVGTSLGVHRKPLDVQLNAVVSVCNAAGAVLSSQVGMLLGSSAPDLAALLAAAIFGWLGACEADSFRKNEASPLVSLATTGVAWRLALPMTLNNLAGGVAGGLAGVGPLEMGLGALIASYVLMYVGHKFGDLASAFLNSRWFDSRLAAAASFLGLCVQQLRPISDGLADVLTIVAALGLLHLWSRDKAAETELKASGGEAPWSTSESAPADFAEVDESQESPRLPDTEDGIDTEVQDTWSPFDSLRCCLGSR